MEEKKDNITKQETVPLDKYIELQKQAEQYLALARQFQADFDNYRKRTTQNIKDAKLDGKMEALDCILPALDSFRKARQFITDKQTLSGVRLIEDDILRALKKLKVERTKALGVPFDPNVHNAVALIDDMKTKSNYVVEEIQSGYTYEGKVLKYSQVIVSK